MGSGRPGGYPPGGYCSVETWAHVTGTSERAANISAQIETKSEPGRFRDKRLRDINDSPEVFFQQGPIPRSETIHHLAEAGISNRAAIHLRCSSLRVAVRGSVQFFPVFQVQCP